MRMVGLKLKRFYHCKQIPNNSEIVQYEKPIEKWGNYQPLSSYLDIAVYGKDIQKRWRLIVNYRGNENEYSVGDLLYLDNAIPDLSKENGENANAIITSVQYGYVAITIEIESIVPKV